MVGKETKAQRFKRIAERRARLILEYLRLLGNCSNKSVYAYTEEDATKIFSAVDKELKRVKALFNKPEKEFTL
jgi:hypothetical protein